MVTWLPNPTTGKLTLQFSGTLYNAEKLQIFDLWGRIIQTEPLLPGKTEHSFSMAALPAGVYFVKVLKDGISLRVEKVVKH